MSYIIRTRCPNGCKYKSGDTCVASECPYQTGGVKYDIRLNTEDKPTKINAQVKQAVKDFAERLRKRIADTMYSREGYVDYDDTMEVIDKTLNEYEK